MKNTKITTVTRTTIVTIVALVAIVMVGWITTTGPHGSARAAGNDDDQTGTAPPVRVVVVKAEQRPLTRVLRMPATLQAGESADLYAKTSGYVSTIVVDIGSRVKKGDALATIDVPEMLDELHQAQAVREAKRANVGAVKAKVAQADSMIATAQAQLQRAAAERELWILTVNRKKELLDAQAIPDQAFDEARTRLAMAEAEVQTAKAGVASAKAHKRAVEADVAVAQSQVAVEEARVARLNTLLKYATIRAPFDGVITDRHVDPGAFVRSAAEGAGRSLLTIANVSYIRLVLEIPEVDTPFVRVGTDVTIDVKALNDDPFTATITRSAVALKANTRTMRVEVDLDNRSGRLAPGMYARVEVKLESKAQAMLIPSKAIRVRGKKISVLVAQNGIARAKPVTIGYDDGIWAEIVTGLNGDEEIIISASGAIAPGAPVHAVAVDES
ncbi:MAG: efflux RND transporter periplasmic adaptor subunit [Planctomycetes bacterium]|nr:efflux RND transporter periplasmic adaptor subunit [Planctomycetota bacterium]